MLLEAEKLSVLYGKQAALRDVSLHLNGGEVVGLLGPNGSGKSTLLRALLAQHRFDGGVRWNDRPLPAWPPRQLARQVAYLAQHPLWETGQTVADALRLGRSPYLAPFGLETEHDAEVVSAVARKLGLTRLLDRPLENLSGGQRQRVFVGRCLAQEPRALLLDEPGTHLDLRHQVELGRLLVSLSHEQGMGILMASHDLNLAGAFADRLLLLHEGKMVADGPPREVLRSSVLSPVYGLELLDVNVAESPTPFVIPKLNIG